jgi:uncharacterized protein YjbI with pentapeptide repeats
MENTMIGDKIVKARKKVSLSQAQLAEQLFISPQAVGKWERGESIPDIVTMNKLAIVLGVDLNYFSENAQTLHNEKPEQITNESKNTEGPIKENESAPAMQERELLTNFSGTALAEADFAGVNAPKRKFNGSDLRKADFSGADLTGSTFIGSDIRQARFDGTNLTDCSFSANDLNGASFNKAILLRTEFKASELVGAKFIEAKLTNAKLMATDLTKTIFENCIFTGVDFKSSDLSGVSFNGQNFTDVKFDNAALNGSTFKGATLKNVSFRPTFALTNRFFKTLKTIDFDGAMMDKLTYAALKGIGVDLSRATTI